MAQLNRRLSCDVDWCNRPSFLLTLIVTLFDSNKVCIIDVRNEADYILQYCTNCCYRIVSILFVTGQGQSTDETNVEGGISSDFDTLADENSTNPVGNLIASRPKDIVIFINLVDFLKYERLGFSIYIYASAHDSSYIGGLMLQFLT